MRYIDGRYGDRHRCRGDKRRVQKSAYVINTDTGSCSGSFTIQNVVCTIFKIKTLCIVIYYWIVDLLNRLEPNATSFILQ